MFDQHLYYRYMLLNKSLLRICSRLDQTRDALCYEKELYVLMFNVLDKYDYISHIIDYALKLILNTTPNGKSCLLQV